MAFYDKERLEFERNAYNFIVLGQTGDQGIPRHPFTLPINHKPRNEPCQNSTEQSQAPEKHQQQGEELRQLALSPRPEVISSERNAHLKMISTASMKNLLLA